MTILAPTEDAFKKLSKDQLADLATNPTKIDDILKRHIVDEVLTFDELAAKSSVTTLSGDTLTVANDGGTVTVNGAVVSAPKATVCPVTGSGDLGPRHRHRVARRPVSGPSPAAATALQPHLRLRRGPHSIEVRGVTQGLRRVSGRWTRSTSSSRPVSSSV